MCQHRLWCTAPRFVAVAKELDAIVIEPSYQGPHLTFPLTGRQVLGMMNKFKQGHVLHYKYVIQLLFASRDLNASLPTLVATTVNEGERLTVCGDTHGQLSDLFSIFTINGTPSPTNRYIFNGDFVDRGECGAEVVMTLMAWQLVYPNACMLNRGNHEERSQNETAGFMSEVFDKYNGSAEGDPGRSQLVYDTFECTFDMLPLATLIEKGPRKVIVLHGGLSDRPGIRLEHIAAINRKREIPWGRQTFEDKLFEDLLWSDPKNRLGTEPSTRGAGMFFGADVTEEFCATNGISLVIRSHEMVQEGYAYMHNNRLLTIFSASKYCGRGTNRGAFITFNHELTNSIQQFMAGTLESTNPVPLADGEDSRAPEEVAEAGRHHEAAQEDSNRRMLIERICLNKADLFWFFSNADKENSGFVSKLMWAEGMRTVLAPLDLPYMSLAKDLVEMDEEGRINYSTFLDRYRIEMRPEDSEWQTGMVERVCRKLWEVCSSLEEAYKMFDVNADGKVEFAEFVDAMEKLDVGLSRRQLYELMRSIDKDRDAHIDFKEFADRFQVVFTRIKDGNKAFVTGQLVEGGAQAEVEGFAPGPGADGIEVDAWTKAALQRVGAEFFKSKANPARVFAKIDSNNDGELSPEEFANALDSMALDPPFTPEESRKLLLAMDTTSSGSVNYLEFLNAFKVADTGSGGRSTGMDGSNWQRAVIEQVVHVLYEYRIELAAAFEKFDLDHSGFVSSEEFRVGLQALTGAVGSPLTDSQADEIMRVLDKNGDGKLSYEEFLSGFRLVDMGTAASTGSSSPPPGGVVPPPAAAAASGSGAAEAPPSPGSAASMRPSVQLGVVAAHTKSYV